MLFPIPSTHIYTILSYSIHNIHYTHYTHHLHIHYTYTLYTPTIPYTLQISVLAPNPMMGQTLGSALFSVMFLYSGFFIATDNIPKYW